MKKVNQQVEELKKWLLNITHIISIKRDSLEENGQVRIH
jgi:hypothetical protein